LCFAFEGWHFDLTAQRCDCVTDRNFTREVIAIAMEKFVLADVNDDVEIAGRTAALSSFAVSG